MKWIKHDTDANQDNKLQNVLLDYGLEGYGLYWYCIELIGSKVDKDNITFELEHDARVIARNTGSTPKKIEEMMRYFVKQRLFESTDNVITCLAMAKRLDKSMTSSPQMRQVIGNLALNQTVKEGYVYFIENSDESGNVKEIKVGRSANPSARFSEHKKKYEEFGFNLELIQTIKSDDCISLETEIHRKLKDYQVRKEWFSANEDVSRILRHDYGVTTSCKIRLDQTREDKSKDKRVEQDALLQEGFDIFYSAGLVKKSKAQAYKKFKSLAKQMKADPIEFGQLLAADVQARIAKQQFGIDKLHPSTYLNNQRWTDEHDETNNGQPASTGKQSAAERQAARIAAKYGHAGGGLGMAEGSGDLRGAMVEGEWGSAITYVEPGSEQARPIDCEEWNQTDY